VNPHQFPLREAKLPHRDETQPGVLPPPPATPASSTAGTVAALRAAHQLLEGGSIFPDPIAIPISGQSAETLREVGRRPEFRLLRLFVALRSRFAEDRLALAVDRGVRQAVVLGAGLDTFGLRNPHATRV